MWLPVVRGQVYLSAHQWPATVQAPSPKSLRQILRLQTLGKVQVRGKGPWREETINYTSNR